VVDAGAIGQEHIGKGASILVEAMGLERDFFPEGKGRGNVLGIVAVGLPLLRVVDAVEADTFRALVEQNFEGVTVEDADGGVVT